jgi:hypothetical protein
MALDNQPKFAWQPGTVMSFTGRAKIQEGQAWAYGSLRFTITAVSEAGEVTLRPIDDIAVAEAVKLWPPSEGFVKGQAATCPFKQCKNGTYQAHEAWSVWGDLVLIN